MNMKKKKKKKMKKKKTDGWDQGGFSGLMDFVVSQWFQPILGFSCFMVFEFLSVFKGFRLPCDTSRTKRIRLITKIGKALPHLGGTGKILGGVLHLSITATMDLALIDRGNLIDGDWANYSENDSPH